MSESIFPKTYFRRQDERDDSTFYDQPRKVVHIDDHAIGALQRLYADVVPPGGHLLDLMSSWRSHLPASLRPTWVDGLGMNADEMADNPQLDDFVVQNLNQNPSLPYADDTFDAAMCAVSVQYLTQPIRVFEAVRRVLRVGAPFVVSFSNRCFPSKAVAVWLSLGDEGHIELVQSYFSHSGGWRDVIVHRTLGRRSFVGSADPLYAVIGYKAG